MPIHDQGYRRFGGARTERGNAWLVIARTAMRTMLSNRKFLGLLLLAWAPFLASLADAKVVGHHFDRARTWRPRIVPSTSAL